MKAETYTEELKKSQMLPARNKKAVFYIIFFAVLACTAAFLIPKVIFALHHETTDNAYVKGTVVPISPLIRGTVTEVFIKDNMQVKKGDKLFDIQKDDYQIALSQAKEESSAAEAEVARLDAAIQQANDSINQAESMYVKARTEDSFAQNEKNRYKALVDENLVSTSYFDSIKTKAAESSAQLRSASVSVDIAKSSLKTLQAAKKTAEFKAAAAAQTVKKAGLDLERTTVYAPMDGRIGQNNVKVGRYVQAGQTVISLVDDADLWIEANYKETQMDNIRPGQQVLIKVDAFPEAKITGHVDSIQPGTGSSFTLLPPENATGNFVKVVQRVPVRITVDSISKDALLIPGLSVEPSIKTK